jgi:hypothetical protein
LPMIFRLFVISMISSNNSGVERSVRTMTYRQRQFLTRDHSVCRFHFKPLHKRMGRFS